MIPPEARHIAARLAASPWFPLPGAVDGVRDSVAHVEVDGSVVTVTVADHDGSKREYQAQVVLVSDSNSNRTAPVDPVLPAPAGTAHTQLSAEKKG